MKLIGIAGQRGVGKDTIGRLLADHHGYRVMRMAGYLKNMLRTLLRDAGLDEFEIERRIEGDLKNAPLHFLAGKSVRHAMMTLGTEWRDMIHPELWTSLMSHRLVQLRDLDFDRFVITDIRFPHEVDMVKHLGGIILRVDRPGFQNSVDHPSENLVADLDVQHVIVNDGDINALSIKVNELLASLPK